MKVKKNQIAAKIYCINGVLVQGIIHLGEGERTLDLANDEKRKFMPVTKVKLFYTSWPYLKKVSSSLIAKRDVIILNKASIAWVEEDVDTSIE
ncbi:MAG: hypothetical protein Q8N85_01455 [Candidatus Omnitrophota bacterium]|nr:hypothetical protein [Candidatus Omnitrophota bacterium]